MDCSWRQAPSQTIQHNTGRCNLIVISALAVITHQGHDIWWYVCVSWAMSGGYRAMFRSSGPNVIPGAPWTRKLPDQIREAAGTLGFLTHALVSLNFDNSRATGEANSKLTSR